MAEPNLLADAIREARERMAQELRSQAEHLDTLSASVAELRRRQEQTAQAAERQWDALAQAEASLPRITPEAVLENVLNAVRNLMTCTLPEQVLQVLTDEAAQWGVRAAVFDVRGKAAWGAAARGFGPELTEQAIRSLIVPLNQGNPFRQVCEIAGHVDTNVQALRKNRNLLEKLKPVAEDPVLLLPIRSAGAVTAILYADPGGKGEPLPINALKIFSEFAGAQLDRLMALSEDVGAREERLPGIDEVAEEVSEETVVAAEAPELPKAESEIVTAEPLTAPPEGGVEAAGETNLVLETVTGPGAAEAPASEGAAPAIGDWPIRQEAAPVFQPSEFDLAELSEEEQKLHKDAKRFAKLLVSEIELYNKVKVADGRRNKDLYVRLKSDIDRSRQTFDKRFGKVLSKGFDHFHDELVRILAANDPSLLGPEYPGPAA